MDNETTPSLEIMSESLPAQNPVPPSRSKLPVILLVIILLFLFGSGGILLGKYLYAPQITAIPTLAPQPTVIPTRTPDVTGNWKTYTDTKHNFSLKYPENQFNLADPPKTVCPQPFNGGNVTQCTFGVLKSCSNSECDNLIGIQVYLSPNDPNYKSALTDFSGSLAYSTIVDSNVGGFPAKMRVYTNPARLYGQIFYVTSGRFSYIVYGRPDDPIFDQILSTFKFTSQVSNPDQQAVTSLVNNFYSALTNQDGKTLFSYMTPPSTSQEISDYRWLTGTDTVPTPFYRAFMRMKILNPKINDLQKVNDVTYNVSLSDQFQNWPNAGPSAGTWSSPQNRNSIVITAVNLNGKWLVDKFTDQSNTSGGSNAGTPKYNGFGQ